jgi:SMODS-associating 2TM, beta-strand rich effector domain
MTTSVPPAGDERLVHHLAAEELAVIRALSAAESYSERSAAPVPTVGDMCHPASMKPKSLIRATAYTVGGVWSVAAALAGLQFDATWKKAFSFLPLLLVLLFTVWDLWLWKLPLVVKYVGVPDLNGTWLGEYESEWIDSQGHRNRETAPAVLTVKQDYTTLSVVLVSGESKSYSVLSHVTQLESGEYRINYEYSNTPLVKYRQKMPSHLGSAELTIASARGRHLAGEYWTNRMSQGALSFNWISDRVASTVEAAQHLPDKGSERDA